MSHIDERQLEAIMSVYCNCKLLKTWIIPAVTE